MDNLKKFEESSARNSKVLGATVAFIKSLETETKKWKLGIEQEIPDIYEAGLAEGFYMAAKIVDQLAADFATELQVINASKTQV